MAIVPGVYPTAVHSSKLVRWALAACAGAALGLLAGCGGTTQSGMSDPFSRGFDSNNGKANAPGGKPAMNREHEVQAVRSSNESAFALVKALKLGESKHNETISPLSVNVLLAMVLNGVAGETQKGLATAMHVDPAELGNLNEGNQSLLARLQSGEEPPLQVANAIWSRPPVQLGKPFADSMTRLYGAQIASLSQDNAEAVRTVNAWVAAKTKERIKKLFEKFKDNEKIVLVNALAFDGLWAKPFDQKLTKKATFHAPTGERQVDMMSLGRTKQRYAERDGLQAVSLECAAGAYRVAFILPAKEKGVAKTLAEITPKAWSELLAGMASSDGDVSIPRFTFECSYDLVPPLTSMGAGKLFEPSGDFAKMTGLADPACVTQVVHKTFIQIDEKGAKAAAATGAAVGLTAMRPTTPFTFVADRPFLYAILDGQTDAIVFIGVVNEP